MTFIAQDSQLAAPLVNDMLADVIAGLDRSPKSLPSKYFYDDRGSQLFEVITDLGEYYLTRAELQIMQQHACDIASVIGDGALIIEYGSGSSKQTRTLLDALAAPAGYVPVDISGDFLAGIAEELRTEYVTLPVLPVAADFTNEFDVPKPPVPERRRIAYFPGSTIGNFSRVHAVKLLRSMASTCGTGGAILIEVDLAKDQATVCAAYNDVQGVTVEFNLNILRHINHVLRAEFDTQGFSHRAVYNHNEARIEMYLVSDRYQCVTVCGRLFEFEPGEAILTEYSHKYSHEAFASLAAEAGVDVTRTWVDEGGCSPSSSWNGVDYSEPDLSPAASGGAVRCNESDRVRRCADDADSLEAVGG